MTLSELVVGTTQWTYDPQYDSEWTVRYGYLDSKPEFYSNSAEQGVQSTVSYTHPIHTLYPPIHPLYTGDSFEGYDWRDKPCVDMWHREGLAHPLRRIRRFECHFDRPTSSSHGRRHAYA